MFAALPKAAKSAYQEIGRADEQVGGVAAFLYSDVESALNAYAIILSGFGESGDDDLFQTSIETRSGVGEKCSLLTATVSDRADPDLRDLIKDNCDMVFVTAAAVVHIRISGLDDPASVLSFGKRLEARIRKLMTG